MVCWYLKQKSIQSKAFHGPSNYMSKSILKVENLKTYFPVYRGIFVKRKIGTVKAVDGISFTLNSGDSLGLAGESGCGKSTLAKTLLRLSPSSAGNIYFKQQDITHLPDHKLRKIRTQLQIVFQDPYASLNPRMTVFDILSEPILEYKIVPKKLLVNKISELMNAVGLSPNLIKKYPHEFSGGQRQRVAIARALSVNPQMLIADEPVSALDVSIQAQILNLISDLQKKMGLTLLFISHNLAVIRYVCAKTAVMYAGKILETGDTESIFSSPAHPYTKALIKAVPIADPTRKKQLLDVSIKPLPLMHTNNSAGCVYHNRCPIKTDICTKKPALEPVPNISSSHLAACHNINRKKV
jgi:oligopeptide/dipeptide ABC transporter ATP-binding protein